MIQRLQQWTGLRRSEIGPVLWMMGLFGLFVFALLLGRTVRDALFLSRIGATKLPWMYVGTAVSVTFATLTYTRFMGGKRPASMMVGLVVMFAVTFTGFRFFVAAEGLVPLTVLYLWVEVMTALLIIQFWNVANEYFNTRQAKRVYSLIAAGQVFGNLATGAVAALFTKYLGVENLLLVLAGALMLSLVVFARAVASASAAQQAISITTTTTTKRTERPPKREDYQPHMTYLLAVGGLVFLTYFTTSLVDFQFKVVARQEFQEEELARFFGLFYGGVGALSFFVQIFLVNRIVRVMGLFGALAMMPIGFVVAGFATFTRPTLFFATGLKFNENALRYTVNDPLTQLLYIPLNQRIRSRVQSWASGIVKPVSMGISGLVMMLVAAQGSKAELVPGIAAVTVAISFVWLAVLFVLKRRYVSTLVTETHDKRRSLERARVVFDSPETQRIVRNTFTDGTDDQCRYLLQMASVESLGEFADDIQNLAFVETRSDAIRSQAIDRLIDIRGNAARETLQKVLEAESDNAVHASALVGLARLGKSRDFRDLIRYEHAQDIGFRTVVLRGLLTHGGEEGLIAALDQIELMLDSEDAHEQRIGLELVALLPPGAKEDKLRHLLEDGNDSVRAQLLQRIDSYADVDLAREVVDLINDDALGVHARMAACKIGWKAVDLIDSFHKTPMPHEELLRWLPGIPMLSGASATHWAQAQLCYVDELVLIEPLVQLLVNSEEPVDEDLIHREMLRLTKRIRKELAYLVATTRTELHPQADATIRHDYLRWLSVLVSLMSLRRGADALRAVSRLSYLSQTAKRHNVIEIVDQVLDREWRERTLLLFEFEGVLSGDSTLEEHADLQTMNADTLLEHFSEHDGWIGRLAVYLRAKQRLEQNPNLDPNVSLTRKERDLMQTVEKVLFLTTVDLFKHLPGEQIEQIATIAQESIYDDGERVIKQGDPGDFLFLITNGKVKVHLGDKHLAELGQGACVGEMAILDDLPRSADVTAVTELTTLRIDREDFEPLLETNPGIGRSIMRVLTERLRKSNA